MIHIKNGTHGKKGNPGCRMGTTGLGPRRLRHLIAACAALLIGSAAPGAGAQGGPQKLETIRLNAGMHLIQAEVARSAEQRQIGLMHRPNMPTNNGMLFVFEERDMHCFWMKNTLLPLAIAFVGDDGVIVNIEEMQANTEVSHCPRQAVRYALEMNRGWFAKRGIQPGGKIGGGPFTTR